MQLAISNLAWSASQDREIASLLLSEGVHKIELAPTKLWPNLLEANPEDVKAYRSFWNDQGIEIVAFQSILFGRPDLTLFESAEARTQTRLYLGKVMDLAEVLGARILVFGSPKNRLRGEKSPEEARAIAQEFFAQVGQDAHRRGQAFCIEPNPPAYACDFATTAREALELVESVNTPGFSLHLDIACAHLAGEDLLPVLAQPVPTLKHFHASRESLQPVSAEAGLPYGPVLAQLRTIRYGGDVSIEMREAGGEGNLSAVREAVRFINPLL